MTFFADLEAANLGAETTRWIREAYEKRVLDAPSFSGGFNQPGQNDEVLEYVCDLNAVREITANASYDIPGFMNFTAAVAASGVIQGAGAFSYLDSDVNGAVGGRLQEYGALVCAAPGNSDAARFRTTNRVIDNRTTQAPGWGARFRCSIDAPTDASDLGWVGVLKATTNLVRDGTDIGVFLSPVFGGGLQFCVSDGTTLNVQNMFATPGSEQCWWGFDVGPDGRTVQPVASTNGRKWYVWGNAVTAAAAFIDRYYLSMGVVSSVGGVAGSARLDWFSAYMRGAGFRGGQSPL